MPRVIAIIALAAALAVGILLDFIPPALLVVLSIALGFLLWCDAKKDDKDDPGRWGGDSEGRY